MPTEVEDMLRGLEDADGGDAGEETKDEGKKNPVRDLRKFAETVLAEKKQADTKIIQLEKELETFRAERESSVFADLGLSDKQKALFKAVNPDAPVTKEAVQKFLVDYDLAAGEDGEAGESTAPEVSTGFKPTAPVGDVPGSKTYSSKDIVDLIMSGRAAEAHEIVTRATRNPNLIQFKHADKMPA